MALAAAFAASPALAEDLTDWSVAPAHVSWGDWTATLGGLASGSAFATSGLGSGRDAGANFSAFLYPRISETLDNGWEAGVRSTILAYHDRLAGDVYGDRTFEKAYLFLQTAYGRFEAGQADGAAYRLSVTGPSVDEVVAIDNAGTTFFRDPSTGRAVIDQFRIETADLASSNDAKFTYLSPQWFGLQLGGSYTPYDARGGLPFISRGAGGAGRQTNIFEGAANYSGYAGELSYGLYAALSLGHDDMRTPGHDNLVDWSVGGEGDYSFDAFKFALGAAFRQSNAYAFDIRDVRDSGETNAWHVSTTLTKGPWIAGFEVAKGEADNAVARAALDERGFEASLGYVLNSNLQLTLGWQGLRFRRNTGVFFNGSSAVDLNAEFLHLRFHV
jgi:hypothetical protein